MALPAILELTNGTGPATPAAGLLDLYGESTSSPTKRLWSIDDAGTKIAYVGQATVDTLTNKTIDLAAGAAGGAPFNFQSGTVATSPVAGDMEYDGKVHYSTHATSERGVALSEQFISMQGGTYTLTSQTALQKLFNSPASGQLTVAANTAYEFECMFDLSSMSSSSGNLTFGFLGTAGFTYLKYVGLAQKTGAIATPTADSMSVAVNTAAAFALVAATTATTAFAFIKGTLRISTTGTIIPAVGMGVAAAAVVGQDSWFSIRALGLNTVTSIGNWS